MTSQTSSTVAVVASSCVARAVDLLVGLGPALPIDCERRQGQYQVELIVIANIHQLAVLTPLGESAPIGAEVICW
ncbi:hypothetical protein ABZV93_06545 [Actinopolymorpha sp. NPDC004070]|uniref:hypothetical protein n=1 Tax=Actinopolymorpha sp. NPDC004070 TaxID=3154548 RepID=UPI0033BDB22D